MKKKNLFTMVGSLALVGAIGVGATLAYLSDTDGELTNTFTVGEGLDIVLDEKVYNESGRTEEGNNYNDVMPGVDYFKDPTVTLVNSETEQYVFMSVKESDDVHVKAYNTNNAWTEITDEVDAVGFKVYVYYETVQAGKTTDQNVADDSNSGYQEGLQLPPLFSYVTIDSEANTGKEKLDDIKVKAAAVQAAGFDTATDAYAQVSEFLQF